MPDCSSRSFVLFTLLAAGAFIRASSVQGAVPLDLPLRFEPSSSDDHDVKFRARSASANVFLTSSGGVIAFKDATLHFEFRGANPVAKVAGLEECATRSNYFVGSPARWRRNVPSYAKVKYTGIYSGIDLLYYSGGGGLEYDLVLAPGARSDLVALNFRGARFRVDSVGDVSIQAGVHELRIRRPRAYQEIGGARREVEASFRIRGGHQLGLAVSSYDRRYPLVIDPVLNYSTYLGGSGDEGGIAVAVDAAGNAYIAGSTSSASFPKMPGRARVGSDTDAYIAKLNSAGTALVSITYLGGTGNDVATGVSVDASGNVYVAGGTGSRDFPISRGALQASYASSESQDLFWWMPGLSGDAFVAKLNPGGDTLLYSTFLGGNGADLALRLRVDASGNAFVAGATTSKNFPTTPGAFQLAARGGASDSWVAKINASGSALVYSTYLSGTGDAGDAPFGLAVDALGNAYVTGVSDEGFPVTTGTFQPQLGGRWDAYVAKLNPTGTGLTYATYLGGGHNSETYGFDVAVDANGNAYITGTTSARDFPVTKGAFSKPIAPNAQGGKVFVAELNANGSALLYSTWLGGSSTDYGLAIALGSTGNAYVAGRTRSRDFPQTGDTLQCRHGGGQTDAFLLELNAAGSQLLHSTYLGGGGDETVGGVVLDSAGNVIVVGSTTSSNYPVGAGAYQAAYGGSVVKSYDSDALTPFGGDGFVAKIALDNPPTMTIGCVTSAASFDSAGVSPGEIVALWGLGIGPEGGASSQLDASGRLSTSIAETQVFFDGIAAPLSYVSANLINAVAPYEIAMNPVTRVQVQYRGSLSDVVTWPVLAVHPGIFTADSSGVGQGAILNEDGSYNSTLQPAARGSVITLFGTGAGQTDPPGEDGKLNVDPLPKPLASIGVYIYGKKAEVVYAGAAPTLVAGALQVNARVPMDIPTGDAVPIWLVAENGLLFEGVTVAIK